MCSSFLLGDGFPARDGERYAVVAKALAQGVVKSSIASESGWVHNDDTTNMAMCKVAE
jgi:hypothetical protein